MSQQAYLIDTNILIGLEDNHTVEAAYSRFHALALTHKVDISVIHDPVVLVELVKGSMRMLLK